MDIIRKIKKMGGIELLFSLYPILQYYSYGVANSGDYLIVILALYIFFIKKKYPMPYKPIILLVSFILLHEVILSFYLFTLPNYFINNTFMTILRWVLILFIVPGLNEKKLYDTCIVVTWICMGGLLYHFVCMYFLDISITPLRLPFMPSLDETARYLKEIHRPSSFFPESAAYTSYMMVILAWCLYRRNILMGIIITFTVLLSTSSNGFFQTILIWSFYLLLSPTLKLKYKILMPFVAIGIVYLVVHSALFEVGIQKIQNTNFEDNVRVTAGFNVYKELPWEHQLLGINEANPLDYIKINPNILYPNFLISINLTENTLFLPRFWSNIIKFGVIGIILYLYVFLFLYSKCKELRPYIFVWLVSIMVQSGDVVFPMTFMLVVYRESVKNKLIN